jgi:Flp pilus assembly pilin Flp
MDFLNTALLRILNRHHELQARFRHENGQTLAEYGLILTLVAVAVVVTGVLLFRNALSGAFTAATNCFDGTC